MNTATIAARVVTIGMLLVGLAAEAAADILILRDGRRLSGTLVSVRGGVIEFEEDRGVRGSRLLRIDRDEVRAIELDDPRGSRDTAPARGGPPPGMREREVIVSADVAWVDTGIDVRAGQVIYCRAVGRVTWGRGRRDGPAGERDSPYNANRPLPQRPAAALIGRIGTDDGEVFFIGDESGPVRLRSSGRLSLGINDDYLLDNSGNFRVVVFY